MKLWPYVLASIVIATALSILAYLGIEHPGNERASLLTATAWQRMASPGALSQGHSFLEHDCAACHIPAKGPEAINCITCHANNEALLTTQSTAFHADVGSCRSCHIEHLGVDRRPIGMDHRVLAKIGNARTPQDEGHPVAEASAPYADISALEAGLVCASCHSNQDPHRALFGNDCASCHSTAMWSIPEFRHPTVMSTDCAQCHQAPPSHYMMHFKMVSMKVTGIEHAEVSQCFLCHQTNSWNDIKGVGWYKHH